MYVAWFFTKTDKKDTPMVVGICCKVFEQKQTKRTPLWKLVYIAGFLIENRQKEHRLGLVYLQGF